MTFVLAAVAAVVFAELVGYWMHMLLHSESVPYLSRSHMIHHLVIYGPDKPQRQSHEYLVSTYGRSSVLGLGGEWLLPVLAVLALIIPAMTAGGVPAAQQALFVAVALGWGALMFWYMHDAMHIKDFWMENNGALRSWFLAARRRHDIHHMDLSDDGKMLKNFGICFFAFDRLFGTFAEVHERFNRAGLEAAKRRYAAILE